jgi:integrase
MATKLTKRLIDAVEPTGRDQFLWDSEIRGFGFKFAESGKCTFIFNYRTLQRRSRRITIGDWPAMTVEEARVRAGRLRVQVRDGQDPLAERAKARQANTLSEVIDAYRNWLGPGTQHNFELVMAKDIHPVLGNFPVEQVRRGDVIRLYERIKRRAPGTARSAMRYLRSCWNWGVDQQLISDSIPNPASGVAKNNGIRTYARALSPDQYQALFEAIQKAREAGLINPFLLYSVELIMVTGLRKRNATGLRKDQIKYHQRVIVYARSPDGRAQHKTFEKEGEKTIAITDPVADILCRAARTRQDLGLDDSEFVFPSSRNGPVTKIEPVIRALGEQININRLCAHNLRSAYINHCLTKGIPLERVKHMVWHASIKTTEAHYLASRPAQTRADAEAVAKSMQGFRGQPLPEATKNAA